MKIIISLIVIFFSVCAWPEGVNKWTDENGKVHFGDRPPVNVQHEVIELEIKPEPDSKHEAAQYTVDEKFLIGRWKSEEYIAYGTKIPSQVYVFGNNFQKVEGSPMTLSVKQYVVQSNVVHVVGEMDQEYTVIDKNTVSYHVTGSGIQKLHRI